MADDADPAPRYCTHCGEIFDARLRVCPECGARWPRTLPVSALEIHTIVLTELGNLRQAGTISEETYRHLRSVYEARLIAERSARKPKPEEVATLAWEAPSPETAAPATVSAKTSAPRQRQERARFPQGSRPPRHVETATAVPQRPPPPPRDVVGAVRQWTTARQADLVLYLGAFLLSISALILVDYQGSALNDLAKSAILGGYTLLFLVLGMMLRRWDRVKEASPVFLALGAILTPLNFLMLYTGVLREGDTPQEWVWLIGSTTTAALYYFLAFQGFGRLYIVPAGVATLLAWGSLGATLNLPARWFGAWFMVAALATNAVQRTTVLPRRLCEVLATTMGVPALAYALLWQLDDSRSWQLPITTLLAAATISISAFPSKRVVPLAMMPPLAGLFAGSFTAAVPLFDDAGLWLPLWMLIAAAGYVALVEVRKEPRGAWLAAALVICGLALLYTHRDVGGRDELHSRLPVTYLGSLLLAAFVAWRHRLSQAFLLLPPLAAGSGASLWWYYGSLEPEWLGLVFVLAGAGYIPIAWLRPAESRHLRLAALGFGGAGLVLSIGAAGIPDTREAQLPITFGFFALATAVDGIRFRPSLLLTAPVLAYGGGSAVWAAGYDREWWVFPAAALSLGLAASEPAWRRDRFLALSVWPEALVLALTPVLFVSDFRLHEVHGAAAFALAAATFLTASIMSKGALSRLLQQESPSAGIVEQQMLARGAGGLLFVAIGYTNSALGLDRIEGAWTFTVVGIACWLAVPLFRPKIALDAILGPIGFTALVVAMLAAGSDAGQATIMVAIGAAAGIVAIGGSRPMYWRATAAGLGVVSLVIAMASTSNQEPNWHVPLAISILFLAALGDALFRRFEPSWLAVPFLGSLAAAAGTWWQEWAPVHNAWVPLAFSIAIGLTFRMWGSRPLLGEVGWPYALMLTFVPVALASEYETRPVLGIGAFAIATASWAIAAVRSDGRLVGPVVPGLADRAAAWDRRLLTWGASGFAFGVLASLNGAFDISGPDRAWLFCAASTAAFAVAVVRWRHQPEVEWLAIPGAFAAFAAAVSLSAGSPGQVAAVLAIAATLNAALTWGTRRLQYGLSATAMTFGALASAWYWQEWPAWTLALAYAALAVALFAGLAPFRRAYKADARGQVAIILSVLPMLAALGTGYLALSIAGSELEPGERLSATAEWATWAGLIAIAGLMLTAEGLWRRIRPLIYAGSAVLLVALEFAVAIFDPPNELPYTLLAAAYFIGLGLVVRSRVQLAGPNLLLNELWLVIGSILLVFTPARLSLAGDAMQGLVLIGEGLALLVGGLVISQRWLTVAGVLTLGASAVRFFTAGEGSRLPYWLTLGVVGLLLLALGVLLLLERDWWSRTRQRLGRWWFGDQPLPG